MKPYKTLISRADAEFVINKSRFIGHGKPVESEEEALAFLAEMRETYKDATHNCYAYIVGANMGVMRYSDDGEPGGTAGMPIIEVLKARGVTNCCVVVTRYFGGILLGAGVMHPTLRILVDVPYAMLSRVEFFLKSAPVLVEDKAFAEQVTLTLLVRDTDAAALEAKLIDLSEGTLEPVRFDEFYYAWKEEVPPA